MTKNKVEHICMLIYNYWPEKVGGAENQCRKLVKHLIRKGFKCSVVSAKTRRDSKYHEFDNSSKIIRIPVFQILLNSKRLQSKSSVSILNPPKKKSKISAGILKWLNMMIFMLGTSVYLFFQRKKIDIIHVHIADWIAGFAGFIGHYLKIPVICKGAFIPVFPELGKDVPFSKTIDAWRRRIAYFALTEYMMKELVMKGVPKEHIFIVPNLVEIPKRYSNVEKNNNILYVGNFSQPIWHKAFDVLFNAWCIVHSKEPEAKLIVAGEGPTELWKKYLSEKNAGKSVQFAGFVSDLRMFYENTSIFILPSRSEGISNALLEAQSWGIPAIATDIPGNRAVVIDEITGILIPVNDVHALSEAILTLLKDPMKRKRMGAAARKRVINFFSPPAILGQIIKTYRGLLKHERLN